MAGKLDLSTFIGIIVAFVLVGLAISFGGSGRSFFDAPAILIVLGGTFAVTMASFTFKEFFRTPGVIVQNVSSGGRDPQEVAVKLLDFAEVARKKGILDLQQELDSAGDSAFLQKGMALVIDGVEADEVERVMRQEMHSTVERHMKGAAVLRKMAEVSPAMGLIGTWIGLVQMLGNLEDPSKIGPAMAVALLTTLYGAMLAYMLFAPLASKLERNSAEEMLVKSLYLRGMVSIAKKENPRRLEMMLNTILPPSKRLQYFD